MSSLLKQTVVVYLHTPLVQLESKEALLGNTHRLKGKVLSEEPSGLIIDIEAVGDHKKWHEGKLPINQVFIPLHKIDFVAL